ncbi:MAG: ATP-binding protein [Desulfobulbus sp.]
MFEPFFTTARSQGSTGLGLHIVFNIVTRTLQGTLDCESSVGQGTSFILTMPV